MLSDVRYSRSVGVVLSIGRMINDLQVLVLYCIVDQFLGQFLFSSTDFSSLSYMLSQSCEFFIVAAFRIG